MFPYAGYSFEKADGSLNIDVAGPMPSRTAAIDYDEDYFSGGINFNAVYNHFLEAQIKFFRGFKDYGPEDRVSGLLNLYFSRHWGVSYRYKHMELSNGFNKYHFAGILYSF